MLSRLPWPAVWEARRRALRRLDVLRWAVIAGLLMSACMSPAATSPSTGAPRPSSAMSVPLTPGLTAVPGLMPFPIEQNVGQAGSAYSHILRAGSMKIGFGAGEVAFVLTGFDAPAGAGADTLLTQAPLQSTLNGEQRSWTVRQELIGASRTIPSGTVGSPTMVSYLKGPAEGWLLGVPAFQQVAYSEAWPGITVAYDRASGGMKSSYHVAAGANPDQIRLLLTGAQVRIDESGAMIARTPLGELRESPPVAWQDRNGSRSMVSASFQVLSDPAASEVEYGFALGAYDTSLPLVIDPQISYASYLGGSGADQGRSVAVDSSGNLYITGLADAPGIAFPGGPATFDNTHNGDWDAFVAKMNPAGNGLLYASFIGGNGQDIGFGIAVDSGGAAYVAGLTTSSQATFPTGGGLGGVTTFDGSYNGGIGDAFVAKVNPGGTALVYAGYVGGNAFEQAQGIALDGAGNAYIVGHVESSEATFPTGAGMGVLPTVNGTYHGGGGDAFIAKINAAGTALIYAGYIGGSGYDHAYGIAVDGSGNAYVTGRTESSEATFPTGTGFGGLTTVNGTYGGVSDGFVVKVSAAGTSLLHANYIGGAAYDYSYSIAVDTAGAAYMTGRVDAPFATALLDNGSGGTVPTFDGSHNGSSDAYIVKLNPAGNRLAYASYIGGNQTDSGVGVAVDNLGAAYITGYTNSNETTFPTGSGMGSGSTTDATYNGNGDAFVAKVSATGTGLLYAGFLGSNGSDSNPPWSTETGIGIAVDQAGNAYVTGRANASEAIFPDGLGMSGLPTVDATYAGGDADAFVIKVAETPSCALAGRQARVGLSYSGGAANAAYYDYVMYGSTNSYYALVYLYQAYVNSQAGSNALASGSYATAKSNFNQAASHAYNGYQYAYASYSTTGSIYAYYAYEYGYYTWLYENQADLGC